jgi:hypothetical protein
MCTVTLIARKNGFALGMNRDEQLTRIAARPPSRRNLAGRPALFPSEPGGGAWIGVNDAAVGFALINWYAVARRVKNSSISRGQVVTTALSAATIGEMKALLKQLPLPRINPFRLIGVFAPNREVVEWRWNLKQLVTLRHPWASATWISSGFDEAGAQAARGKVFAEARRQRTFGRLGWLRRLHRSHQPERGAYSTCMHREDAATVSYTEIVVQPGTAVLRYKAGAPCENGRLKSYRLQSAQLAPEEPHFGDNLRHQKRNH